MNEDLFLDKLKNGIVIKYADIIFGKYFIYIISSNNILYPCMIYNHIMHPMEYKKHDKPYIHFCNCSDLWSIYNKHSTTLKAKIPVSNLFDYQVGIDDSNSSKLFYNVELPFCSKCIDIYERLFLKFYTNDKLEIWNMLFLTNKVIKLEKIAIEDAINLDPRYSHMDVEIGDGLFSLVKKNK